MKKWFCIAAACLLALCLAACGGGAADGGGVPTESPDLLDVARGFRAAFDADEPDADASETPSDETPVLTPDAPQVEDASEVTDAAQATETSQIEDASQDADAATLPEDGAYTTAQDIALYLRLYGRLPGNFITKEEARKLGWDGGSLEPYAPGKCIGGDRFGNYEGLLPSGHAYRECDVDTLGANSRGAKRLVFSDDGLIYYTEDHYNTFTPLYGEE